MSEMGRYCKAYQVKRLREFSGWKEDHKNLAKRKKQENGKEIEVVRSSLADDDILYLQENYVVTDSIFKNENIVFNAVSDDWKKFCDTVLDFRIQSFVTN